MFILATHPVIESYFQSDLVGKAIFLSLLALSIVTWVIFLQKWWIQKIFRTQAEKMNDLFLKKKQHPLTIELPAIQHPFCEVYRQLRQETTLLLNKNRLATQSEKAFLGTADIDHIESHLTTVISKQVKEFEKNLFVLSTVVSLAPFLGLLGTVWGILLTFAQLQNGSGNANSMVMNGLAMALGTTVAGLVVAIPALISYNYLKACLTHFNSDIEDFSCQLIQSVELQYRKVDAV